MQLFCEHFCTKKCTTMSIFKCNSIATLIAPWISTSNVSVSSDKPSGALSTALTCSCLNQVKRQVHPLCHFIVHLQLLSKRTLRLPFKSNIKSTINCTFEWAPHPPLDETFCTHSYINHSIKEFNHRFYWSEASSAPFSATSHTPSCASLWRSLSVSFGAPSNAPSGALLDYIVEWVINSA